MRKNIWKVLTLVIIIVVVYGIIDIYHTQYNLVKHINSISSEIRSVNHIEVLERQIKAESFQFIPKLEVKSANVNHRRLYTSSSESDGRVPYELKIAIECRQSFLGLFYVSRTISTKSTVFVYN